MVEPEVAAAVAEAAAEVDHGVVVQADPAGEAAAAVAKVGAVAVEKVEVAVEGVAVVEVEAEEEVTTVTVEVEVVAPLPEVRTAGVLILCVRYLLEGPQAETAAHLHLCNGPI